jgi:hypothetical protein
MIIEERKGNILDTTCEHIVFAVNREGINDSGFAGQVSAELWPELRYCGPKTLGETLLCKAGGKTFHAIICHSLMWGWKGSPEIIKTCLDNLDIPSDEEIACTRIGSGLVGQLAGANPCAILQAMDNSNKKIILYTR